MGEGEQESRRETQSGSKQRCTTQFPPPGPWFPSQHPQTSLSNPRTLVSPQDPPNPTSNPRTLVPTPRIPQTPLPTPSIPQILISSPRTLVPHPRIPQTPLLTPRTLAQSVHPPCTSALPSSCSRGSSLLPQAQSKLPSFSRAAPHACMQGPRHQQWQVHLLELFFLTFTTQPSPSLSKQKLPGDPEPRPVALQGAARGACVPPWGEGSQGWTEASPQRGPGSPGPRLTDVVEDVGPALHGDALEHRQDSLTGCCRVGDAGLGPAPVPRTSCALAQPRRASLPHGSHPLGLRLRGEEQAGLC